MKKNVFILAVIFVFGVSVGNADKIKKLSLDDASTAGTTIINDKSVKVEGKASLRIQTLWPTVICLGEAEGLNIEEARLIYSASVKSDLSGSAYLEMWVHVDGGQYFSRGLNDTVEGAVDWKTIRTAFLFQKGQKPDKVTLNIVINGRGTVWVDDVRLSGERQK
ncbi:MAG: hypothetical protein JXB26_16305 [Candidatus Aminicenantes bacterium]|nr:hypothetical protein [Candidatus Aminicenantes bacterium]